MEGNGRKILLAQDDPTTRRVLKQLLERIGFVVRDASTFTAAAKSLAEARFDLLITEVRFHDGDGWGLVDGIPTIFFSGDDPPADWRERHSDGAVQYLVKPILFEKLSDAIAKALSDLDHQADTDSESEAPAA